MVGCVEGNLFDSTQPTFSSISIMRNLLYLLVFILIISWAVGYFGYETGGVIHFVLVIALILLLFQVLQDRKG